ncbi:MAG: amidase [Bacteroidales bacterium]|nr:amidase [Bacteroidales bacterium]
MNRRVFIKGGAIAGAAVAGIPWLQSCRPAGHEKSQGEFITDDFEIKEESILQMQQYLETGNYTSEKLVELYLARIQKLDKSGPVLNSVIEINPEAFEIARQLDQERKSGKVRSPLHGIPVMIKDNIETADRMLTTAGSLALASSPALQDAFIVKKLREAGAIILGKTNLSEWANFRSTHSSSGWSGRGGQTRNPYITDRNPCGSSSGSGVAVSANFCAAAIGTETDGSIVCPSSINGVVGIKPTLGLWSRSGIVPIAHSQDTAGPMARTVSDAAVILGLLAGVDPDDMSTSESTGKKQSDYTRYLDVNGLSGARIGVARNFFGFSAQVDQLMEDAILCMSNKGAEIIDPANILTSGEMGAHEWEVLLYEFKADLNLYLSKTPPGNKTRTLGELIAFNEQNRDREMPWFGQEIFIMAEEKGPLTDKVYLDALENMKRLAGKEGIDATLQQSGLDAIIAPTGGPAWTTDWINGDHFIGGSSTPAACAGYPAITVPAGFVHGLPVGITFMGSAWSEPTLLKLAFAFEQATLYRKAPEFRTTLT